jgi:hypothetical protein
MTSKPVAASIAPLCAFGCALGVKFPPAILVRADRVIE